MLAASEQIRSALESNGLSTLGPNLGRKADDLDHAVGERRGSVSKSRPRYFTTGSSGGPVPIGVVALGDFDVGLPALLVGDRELALERVAPGPAAMTPAMVSTTQVMTTVRLWARTQRVSADMELPPTEPRARDC